MFSIDLPPFFALKLSRENGHGRFPKQNTKKHQ